MADTVSISSNEFTGWKVPSSKVPKESDSQSVSSLDFATKVGMKVSPGNHFPNSVDLILWTTEGDRDKAIDKKGKKRK